MNMKKVYRAVTNKYGVSVAEVEREISASIDEIYKNPSSTVLEVNRKGDKPTPEEFIIHMAQWVTTEGGSRQ